MATPKVYALCDAKGKHETMTKEQIMNAIADATGVDPSPADKAFVSMILDQNKNTNLKLWIGTEAQYNALGEYDPDTLYFYPDTDYEVIYEEYKRIQESVADGIEKLTKFGENVDKYPRVTHLTDAGYSEVLTSTSDTLTSSIHVPIKPTARAEIEVVTSCGSGKMNLFDSDHAGVADAIFIPVSSEGTAVGFCRIFVQYDSLHDSVTINASGGGAECRIQNIKIIDY